MSRTVLAVDRVVGAVLGLGLVAAGLAVLAWWYGGLGLSGALDLTGVVEQTRQPWWPWAAGLLGVVLVLLGLRWLAGHLLAEKVGEVRLTGTGKQGRLTAQVKPIAQAAADTLATTDGIRSVRGTIARDRGQLIARLNATVEPQADLAQVAAAADAVSADLRSVLARDDLHCLVDLQVARRGRQQSRVS